MKSLPLLRQKCLKLFSENLHNSRHQFISNSWKKSKIVVPCWLQQCFEPLTSWLPMHGSLIISARNCKNVLNFLHISEMQSKIDKMCFLFEIKAFEVIAGISAYCVGNTCHRESTCYQTVRRFQMWLSQTFSNSIYLEFVEKEENSGAVLTSAVFRIC